MTYNTPAAAKSPRTHTVYQFPRSVTWHVERRLPAAVAEALAPKIAGLDFQGVENAQIRSLARTLSETIGDEYVDSILDRPTLSQTAATRAVTSMLGDHLCLSTATHDELEAVPTADGRRGGGVDHRALG